METLITKEGAPWGILSSLWITLGIAFLACTALFAWLYPVYHTHNLAAEKLLGRLSALPLPPDSRIQRKDWEIGGYEGAGTLCEAAAFIIVRSNAPKESVLSFYKDNFPPSAREVTGDYHIAPFDELPPVEVPYGVSDLAEHMPPSQKASTYAIWIILPIGDRSWDIRSW
ncbi:MAG TPA: hypothetical protein VHY09_02780 [Candidatus Methylacidiphilales bacterium]|nr:hypothetical protein [Candidatus Methylacidiphilales bacterium]